MLLLTYVDTIEIGPTERQYNGGGTVRCVFT